MDELWSLTDAGRVTGLATLLQESSNGVRNVLAYLSPLLSKNYRVVPQYARDFSEHCKRRDALPSVFLSRRVMEADAQVLHFSRLDVPYSCFTTVRTESGHSIIMVLDLNSDEYDQNLCKDGDQVAVYEFPETFGGYWGPVPDAVLDLDPNLKPVYTKQYTLAAKPKPVTHAYSKKIGQPSLKTTSTGDGVGVTVATQSFIHIEVPLVNLSASLVPDENPDEKPFDPDEFFDLFYDVMPRPGQPYETSILPLVQIAVKKQDALREGGNGDGEPRYELDYGVGPFTPDHRLTTSVWSTKINTNRNTNRWKKKTLQEKRVEPKLSNTLYTREPAKSRKLKQFLLPTTKYRPSYEPILPQTITETKFKNTKAPFNLIDDIMKSLNNSGELKVQEESTHRDTLAVLNTSENSYNNLSVYLAPYPTILAVSDYYVNFTKIQSDRRDKKIPLEGTIERISWVSTVDSSEDEQENNTTNRAVGEYNTTTYKKKYSLEHPDDPLEGDFVTKEETITPANKIDTIKLAATAGDISTTASQITFAHETQVEHINFGPTEPITDAAVSNTPTNAMTTTHKRSLSGTLVDHESWENVVQSAPVMAGLLNQHGPELSTSPRFKQSDDVAAAQKSEGRLRRKRHIAAIAVEGARPHSRPTLRAVTTRPSVFNAVDVHEFARLMELPDDQDITLWPELPATSKWLIKWKIRLCAFYIQFTFLQMNNHMLIKINPNTSRQLFDMCHESVGTKSRFLVLFNSSRIILSITNFSMPHVMVALTTARPLALLESQCPEDMVECQVEGTRLCIDPNNACDGVPNCGSANAYDEDRVLCGVINLHRNVYLAAVTCLAVLVTMLYVIHYWLQRCVPSVAQAFFVYTDSADNELYLDPIMRSPMDVGAYDDHCIYNSALFDDENMLYSHIRKPTNIFKSLFSGFTRIGLELFKKRKTTSESLEEQGVRLSSSEGMQLHKCSLTGADQRNDALSTEKTDREAQTGESLEIAYMKALNSFKKDTPERKPLSLPQRSPSIHEIELRDFLGFRTSSLDMSTDSPGPSGGSAGLTVSSIDEEKEIQSTFYDPGTGKIIKREIQKSSKGATQGRKCLRFDENTTFIPREDDDGDEDTVGTSTSTHRHSVSYASSRKTGKRSQQKSDGNDEHGGGGSDFRKFFRKKKHNK